MDREAIEQIKSDQELLEIYIAFCIESHKAHCVALRSEEGSYAGQIECRCTELNGNVKNCSLIKSGYIFPDCVEAINWAKNYVDEIAKDLSNRKVEYGKSLIMRFIERIGK